MLTMIDKIRNVFLECDETYKRLEIEKNNLELALLVIPRLVDSF